MAVSVQKQLYILALLIIGILVVSSIYYIAIIRPQELGVSLDESASKPNVIQAYYNGGDMDGSSLNFTFELNSNAHVTVENLKHGLTVNFMVDPLPSDRLTSQPAVTTLAPPQDDEMCVLPRPPLATTPMPEAQPIIGTEDVTNEELAKPITSNDLVALNLDGDKVTTSPILTVPENEAVLNIEDLTVQQNNIQQDQEIKGNLDSDKEMLVESPGSEKLPRQDVVSNTLAKPDNAQVQQMKRETASQKSREPDVDVVADRNTNPIDGKHEPGISQNKLIGDTAEMPEAFQSASKPESQTPSIANSLPPKNSEPGTKISVPTESATAPESDRLAIVTASGETTPENKNMLSVIQADHVGGVPESNTRASEAAKPTPVPDPNKPDAAAKPSKTVHKTILDQGIEASKRETDHESGKITSEPSNLSSVSQSGVPESKTSPSNYESTKTDAFWDLNEPEPESKTFAKSEPNKKDTAPNIHWYSDLWKYFNL